MEDKNYSERISTQLCECLVELESGASLGIVIERCSSIVAIGSSEQATGFGTPESHLQVAFDKEFGTKSLSFMVSN